MDKLGQEENLVWIKRDMEKESRGGGEGGREFYFFVFFFFSHLPITNILKQSIQVIHNNIRSNFKKLLNIQMKIKYQYQRRNKNEDK